MLGADPDHHDFPALRTYNHKSVVHETLTLMGYLSAITERVGLATGILILPQRQTVLVAKQAAEIDVLSGGRLRLGIGVGWNTVEYEALGEDFHNRGARSAEQIEVMRALWTQDVVDFHGKWHNISHAGLNPLPVQRPIPVWLGAGSSQSPTPPDSVLKRVARNEKSWTLPRERTYVAPLDLQRALERIRQLHRDKEIILIRKATARHYPR